MDQNLIALLPLDAQGNFQKAEDSQPGMIRLVNAHTGEIELNLPDGAKKYLLKPLGELFLNDAATFSINWDDQAYMPLLLCIEEEILNYDDAIPDLTDGPVALSLDRMIMNPAAEPGADELIRQIQFRLRLLLSLADYSKYEVKSALRKIAKSVELHSRESGIRGYLDFIRDQFEPHRT